MKIRTPFSTVFFLMVWLTFAHHSTPGQTEDLGPPPPLIYKAPDKSSLKTYTSDDKTFEVVFSGNPAVKNLEPNGFKVLSLQTNQNGSHSSVVVYSYNVIMDQNKASTYGVIRQNILKSPKTTIESELDLKNGEVDGREFNVLSDYVYKRIRVFAKDKRVYVVSCDVTNWHILNQWYKEKVADFKAESERFLNSFKIRK